MNIVSVDILIKNIVLPKPSVQTESTVSPAPIIQNRDEIPSVPITVQNASTDSPATVIQSRNEIPSIQNTSEKNLLRLNKLVV